MTPSETDTTARTRLSTPVALDGHGVQSRRIALFVGFAFTIAWAVGALVYATGGIGWPAVIGHAAINANAGIGLAFTQGAPSSLLGPAPVGIIGLVPLAVLAAWLLVRPGALEPSGP